MYEEVFNYQKLRLCFHRRSGGNHPPLGLVLANLNAKLSFVSPQVTINFGIITSWSTDYLPISPPPLACCHRLLFPNMSAHRLLHSYNFFFPPRKENPLKLPSFETGTHSRRYTGTSSGAISPKLKIYCLSYLQPSIVPLLLHHDFR